MSYEHSMYISRIRISGRILDPLILQVEIELFISIKMDLALNNLQLLIYHKIQSNQTKLILTELYGFEYIYRILIVFKQLYLTHRWDPNRYHHSGSEWNWEWWQWKSDSTLSWRFRMLLVCFGLIGFYGISNTVDYLMPNPVYTYILNIWFLNIFCR